MLLTFDDIQAALNIDLTENGVTRASDAIASAIDYAESVTDFPLEATEVTEYFDEGGHRFYLNTSAPVSDLTLSQYNTITRAFDEIDSVYLRTTGNRVYSSAELPVGFQMTKATYTTGWTAETLPKDIRDALVALVAIKLQQASNFSSNPDDPSGDGSGVPQGALKRVSAGGYSKEYASTANETAWKAKAAQLSQSFGDDVPPEIKRIFEKYRRPFAI